MESRIYLVHQKPHSLKQKNIVVTRGETQEIVNKSTKSNKHTRRTFAGKYIPETKSLIIGIAGNHVNDAFVKSVGSEIARERIEKISKYLQTQKKQVIVHDVAPEQAKAEFFKTIKTLEI